jgi:hypothetical protein
MRHFCSFSEAIREGARIRPAQAFHKFYDAENDGTCATGAALEAIFGETFTNEILTEKREEVRSVLRSDFPYMIGLKVTIPCECPRLYDGPCDVDTAGRIHGLANVVVHLNNHHHWTREQIADWVELEEEKLGFVTLTETTEQVYA